MLRTLILSTIAASGFAATGAMAQDPAAGENAFRSCVACHGVTDLSGEVLVRGGRAGPNLFGVIGREAGGVDGYRYSDALVAAGGAGLVWDEETLAAFIMDPSGYLRTYLDDGGVRSRMSFKARSGAEDIAAYLASLNTAM